MVNFLSCGFRNASKVISNYKWWWGEGAGVGGGVGGGGGGVVKGWLGGSQQGLHVHACRSCPGHV